MNFKILKRLLRYTIPYLPYLVFSLVFAAGAVIFTLLSPVLIGNAADIIVGSNRVDFIKLPHIIFLLALTAAGSALFTWLTGVFNSIITNRTVKDLRIRIFAKLHSLPLSYIDTNPHGGIINRVTNDIDLVSDGLLQALTQFFTGIMTIFGTVIFMLRTDFLIGSAVIVLTPLSLFAATYIARRSYKYFSEQTRTQGEMLGYIGEQFENQQLIIAFGRQEQSSADFETINANLNKCGLKAQIYSALANPCTRFVNGLVYAAVGVIGGLSAIYGNTTVGGVSMFLAYANQYTKPFNEISGIITQLQSALASAARVFDILDMPDEIADTSGAISINPTEIHGNIDIENVCFSYKKDKPLIQNLSLHVKAGSRIAIVGPTGCGKTTLINLLMRFYETDSGTIKIDGMDIRSMTRSSLRLCYGMVLQETWLTEGTVRENITYGVSEADDTAVENAAKRAHAHSFIVDMPNGYDTVISEDGVNLSQGQKQLLCIARVMLCNSPMLILDEATSNIDTRTEIRIQRAFGKMMLGRTSFVVAHRLSTIREADAIIVMRDGNIVEHGTHAELIAHHGYYFELYEAMSVRA